MFLCRTARRTTAALDQDFLGSFLVRVKAHGLGDVVLKARPGCTFQKHRFFCGSADPKRAHLGERTPQPRVLDWDTSAAFVTSDCGHLSRVATATVNLSGFRKDTRSAFLFTGNAITMQTRSASTNSATKKNEEQAERNKGDLQEVSTTSTTEESLRDKPESDEGKPNKTQQLKKVFKEYGAVGVSFHIGISLMSLGMFYLLISSGIDMAGLLCKLGFSETMVQSKMAAGTSTFVLAYAIHKLFAPVRISITLVSVPLIVRYFRKTGLFKPPTPAP